MDALGRSAPKAHAENYALLSPTRREIAEAERLAASTLWQPLRIRNGDEAQRGLNFQHDGAVVQVTVYRWD